MSRFSIIFSSIVALFMGILQLFGIDVYLGKAGTVKASLENGVFFICFGLIFLFISKFIQEKQEKYTKCPKCKEVFNYQELKEGKCKYCEDIETIEIGEYYKKFSKENENDK
ncbi:hypothetical protein OZZ08_02605 [Malaciobacter mytili]|uniref:hypothetical protein n=1 Tax=Malaciobacter mytili TaxID=603050 RepID=UPI003BB1749F